MNVENPQKLFNDETPMGFKYPEIFELAFAIGILEKFYEISFINNEFSFVTSYDFSLKIHLLSKFYLMAMLSFSNRISCGSDFPFKIKKYSNDKYSIQQLPPLFLFTIYSLPSFGQRLFISNFLFQISQPL